MMQTYTDQDLIRFIYKEVDVFEHFEMDYAIRNDENLKEEFNSLKETAEMLPSFSYNPSNECIMNILNYNKKSFIDSLV